MRVGFIGLGRMGHGMATRILNAGHDLTIYDQISSTLETLGAAGASVADSVAQVVAGREIIEQRLLVLVLDVSEVLALGDHASAIAQ